MPYFIFKLTLGSSGDIKNPELQGSYNTYKQAKTVTRTMRAEIPPGDNDTIIKIMFAEDQHQAEDQLMRRRERPILREWEK